VTSQGPCPHRRRRGAALEGAILTAAFAELSEAGYHGFSVESVAARARTGKASIYRRWPSKAALVMDALLAELPDPERLGITSDLGEQVSTADALRAAARAMARVMNSPAGDAIRAVKLEAAADPELARLVEERFQRPRTGALVALLERGVARGEVRPEAATPFVAEVLPAVLTFRIVLQGERLTGAALTRVVDEIMIPLVEARA